MATRFVAHSLARLRLYPDDGLWRPSDASRWRLARHFRAIYLYWRFSRIVIQHPPAKVEAVVYRQLSRRIGRL
jgi:hypothetical protein